MRRLFIDAETSPCVVLSWRTGYKINLDYSNIIKERAIICIGYKWAGENTVHITNWDSRQNDRAMLSEFIPILNSADEIIGHNIDHFDLPWIKTRCLFHKIDTLPKYQTIDTLQWSRRHFYLNSSRLNYVAQFLGIGSKTKTEFSLWQDILLKKDAKALKTMGDYCKQDVILLEKVYDRLAKVVPPRTHQGVLQGKERWSCAKCGSEKVSTAKTRITSSGNKQFQMNCKSCGGYYSISQASHDQYLSK